MYREDIIKKSRAKNKKKKKEENRKRGWFYGDDWLDDEDTDRVWQVVCFTEEDWTHLTEKFCDATSKVERELYRSLSQNFLPEIPRLFEEKERLQRKRYIIFIKAIYLFELELLEFELCYLKYYYNLFCLLLILIINLVQCKCFNNSYCKSKKKLLMNLYLYYKPEEFV